MGVVCTFLLSSIFSPSLWETARYILKYSQRAVKPKTTNQPVPGRPAIRKMVGQGPPALAVGAGGSLLGNLTLIYAFSPLSPSLGDGPI